MTDIEIFSALSLSAPGPHPSITSVQWSGDGQLVVCTKNTIFILTPDLGINFDNLSLLKTDKRNFQERGSKNSGLDLGWHRNLIELDKSSAHSWSSDTQECRTINLGSLEVSWRSVAVSPGNLSNVSTGSGSLLVVMNTNLELTLWCAARNHLKEAWTKMQDITSTLKELSLPQGSGPQDRCLYLKTLQAQVNCMAWSQQADFGVRPNPLVDGSILALGNRAGSIIFMRYDGERSLIPIQVIRVADEWVTRLAWGSWRSYQPNYCESYLACGLADGAIVTLRVRQRLEASLAPSPFAPAVGARVEFDLLNVRSSDSDGKGITALAWLDRPEVPQEQPTLFHAKPGLFHFSRLTAPIVGGNMSLPFDQKTSVLQVSRQTTSVDSSPFYPVSGIMRVSCSESDLLIVTLFDGSFHVVRGPGQYQGSRSPDPEADSGEITSAGLSSLARRVFIQVEGGAARHADVGRISGSVEFDGLGTVLWLHEACRPTDFSYTHDAKHKSMLVVARLWEHPTDQEKLLLRISDTFNNPRSLLGHAPSSILRPILLHICQRKTFDSIWHHVLPLLSLGIDGTDQSNVIVPWSGEIDGTIRLAFRRSLGIDLYGWDVFHSLRLRLAVADYCWKMSPNGRVRDQFGTAAQSLLSGISHRFMKVLVRHLTVVVDSLTERDLPFLMRVIVQSLLPGCPPDLAAEANTLSETTKAKFSGVAPDALGLTETCPACRSPIALENLLTAVCPNGHTWARCSITSFVLASPMVRTCIGCTRKAFLPPSSRAGGQGRANDPNLAIDPSVVVLPAPPPTSNLWIPDAGRSWVVDELLEAARCCLYCGNRFVRIL